MPSAFAKKAPLYITADGVSETRPGKGTEYIAIRRSLTLKEKSELEGALVSLDADMRPDIRLASFLRVANRVAIVDWYLLGEDGDPVPFAEDRIDDLDPSHPLVARALEEWGKINPLRIVPVEQSKSG